MEHKKGCTGNHMYGESGESCITETNINKPEELTKYTIHFIGDICDVEMEAETYEVVCGQHMFTSRGIVVATALESSVSHVMIGHGSKDASSETSNEIMVDSGSLRELLACCRQVYQHMMANGYPEKAGGLKARYDLFKYLDLNN